ncbi:MAG: hypothetical protein K2L70_00255, partial [Clostridia bacterium]|nr:hypothetical protein [Clostridia bacterium]
MKLAKTKYLKCAILIISVCFILGALAACLPFNISIPDKLEEGAINDTAMNITTNSSDGLGEFSNGYSYVYTDKNLIDKYRAGDANTPYDISIVKVDTSQARGTQKNPYIIASIEDWDRFAKNLDDGSIPSYGSGKYFVLAKDIDFDGKTFHPVRFFNGTFYGMGHKLKNISVDGTAGWVYWNNTAYAQIPTSGTDASLGYGVFCRTTNAIITDLIVDNYTYMNMPSTSTVAGRSLANTGGMIGVSNGNDYVLNCHLYGSIKSNIAYGMYPVTGGVIGCHSGVSLDLMIYRCSAEFTLLLSAGALTISGGIIGEVWKSPCSFYIYDSVANFNIDQISGSYTHSSSTIGIDATSYTIIENFIGTVSNPSKTNQDGALTGEFDMAGERIFRNAYVEGTTLGNSMYCVAGATFNASLCTASNLNVVKSTSSYAPATQLLIGIPKEFTSNSTMLTEAKTFFGNNYSQIWDVEKIGGSYDPDNSPVRNYLMAFINFRNLNNGGNSEERVGLEDGEPYVVGDKLPDKTSDVTAFTTYLNTKANANHVFLGWTDDATGNSEPFTELPSGVFGDVTMYAVWGLPDSYVNANIKTSITSDKDKIEYDSVESITLTALVTHTPPSSGSMTNPNSTYYFIQDGTEKTTTASVKNSGVLEVKTVKDSGEYTFKYRLTDGLEPLW